MGVQTYPSTTPVDGYPHVHLKLDRIPRVTKSGPLTCQAQANDVLWLIKASRNHTVRLRALLEPALGAR